MDPADVISWDAMVAGYAQHGSFYEVQERLQAFEPNGIMFICILLACGLFSNIVMGIYIFGLWSNNVVILPMLEHVNYRDDMLRGCYAKQTCVH